MTYGDICFYCKCPESTHTLPGKWCVVCTEEGVSGPFVPDGGEHPCGGYTRTQMCAVCGGRMAWYPDLRRYGHANEEDDDHEAEPRTRRPRKR